MYERLWTMPKLFLLVPLFVLLGTSAVEAQRMTAEERRTQQAQRQEQRLQRAEEGRGLLNTLLQPSAPNEPQAPPQGASGKGVSVEEAPGFPSAQPGPVRRDVPMTGIDLTHPKSHVLLIGVTQYRKPGTSTGEREAIPFSDLRFCVKDMEDLRAALVKARFCRNEDIQLLVSGAGGNREPTAPNVERAFRNMLDNVQEGDRVLVAFSGHGISLTEAGQPVDFLCCADASVTLHKSTGGLTKDGLIRRTVLEENLDVSDADIKLFFIDACRNVINMGSNAVGPGNKGVSIEGVVGGVADFGSGVPYRIQNQGFFRFSSCRPGEVSWEFQNTANGVFTHFLIEGMLGHADARNLGRISLADLFTYARNETMTYVSDNIPNTMQRPVMERSPETEIIEGDVLFSFWNLAGSGGGRNDNKLESLDDQIRRLSNSLANYRSDVIFQRQTYQDLTGQMEDVRRGRDALIRNFSLQDYQNVSMQAASLQVRIHSFIAAERKINTFAERDTAWRQTRVNTVGNVGQMIESNVNTGGFPIGEIIQSGAQRISQRRHQTAVDAEITRILQEQQKEVRQHQEEVRRQQLSVSSNVD